jgi:hypothetical protein
VIHDRMSGPVEPGREVGLRDRHSDRGGKPLAEGARRHLRPGGMPALRMAGCFAPPLAEGLQVVEREVVSGEIKEGIEEHRGVPGGQNEAVPVGPERIGRIVPQISRPEGEGRGGRPHRHAGVAGFRLFDGVRRQKTDRVDALLFQGASFAHDEVSSYRVRLAAGQRPSFCRISILSGSTLHQRPRLNKKIGRLSGSVSVWILILNVICYAIKNLIIRFYETYIINFFNFY